MYVPMPSAAGQFKRVASADPAAGNEFTLTVPVAANEVQSISGTPSGTFGLSLGGEVGPVTLPVGATAAQVQAYLRAFSTVGVDGVTCAGGALPAAITVTFNGLTTSSQAQPLLAVVGGATGITITRTTGGTRGKAWFVVSLQVALVQGITQTPQPTLVIDDGTVAMATIFGSSAAQAVSTTCTYTWAPGLVPTGQVGSGAGVVANAPLPEECLLLAGWRLRSNTLGIGANSDYGVASALVCELGS